MSKLPPEPPDDLTMLEIAEEAYQHFNAKRENALDVQRRAAVQAILNGAVPEEVAQKCGFDVDKEAAQAGVMMTPFGPQPISASPPMEGFAHWLCRWLHRQIIGYDRANDGPYLDPPDEDDDDD
jgi:hypothetical protein